MKSKIDYTVTEEFDEEEDPVHVYARRQHEIVIGRFDDAFAAVLTRPWWCPVFLHNFVRKHFVKIIYKK